MAHVCSRKKKAIGPKIGLPGTEIYLWMALVMFLKFSCVPAISGDDSSMYLNCVIGEKKKKKEKLYD